MTTLRDIRRAACTLAVALLAFVVVPAPPAHALSIAARISDQSTEVEPTDRLYFEVEVKYPENPQRKDLRVEYQIIEDGQVIASEKVLRAVETQASFLDYIVVPESTKGGIKELNVIITDYEDLHQEVSATFRVLRGVDQVQMYFFILLGTILLVGLLVMFQIWALNRRRASAPALA